MVASGVRRRCDSGCVAGGPQVARLTDVESGSGSLKSRWYSNPGRRRPGDDGGKTSFARDGFLRHTNAYVLGQRKYRKVTARVTLERGSFRDREVVEGSANG